jgi:hypothetical protein
MGKIFHGYHGCIGQGYWLIVVEEVGEGCVKVHHHSRRNDYDIHDLAISNASWYVRPPGERAEIYDSNRERISVNGEWKKLIGPFFVGDGIKPVTLGTLGGE